MDSSVEQGTNYFFAFPNNIRNLRSRTLFCIGVCFIVLGSTCFLNAVWSICVGAVKKYTEEIFFNQHWINCFYILVGVAIILAEKEKLNFFLFLSVAFSLMGICLGIGGALSNCINIHFLRVMPSGKWTYTGSEKSNALLYNSIDFLCNIAGTALSVFALWHIRHSTSRYFAYAGSRSLRLISCGLLMTIFAFVNFVNHIIETSTNNRFINYTLDQGFWIMVTMVTGGTVLLVGLKGSRILLHVSLLLCLVSYYPTITYLWFEYRWILHMILHKRAILSDNHEVTNRIGLGINIVFLMILVVTCALLVIRLANNRVQLFEVNQSYASDMRKVFGIIPIIFVAIATTLFIIDAVHSKQRSFYRFFMTSDHILPFLLIPAAVFTLVLNRDTRLTYILMPTIFALNLQILQSSLYYVVSYIFIAQNTYFHENFCEFYYMDKDCSSLIKMHGTMAHFFEAFLATIAAILATYFAIILGQIMGMASIRLHEDNMTSVQKTKKRRHIIITAFLGLFHALLGTSSIVVVAVLTQQSILGSTPVGMLHSYVLFHVYFSPMIIVGFTQFLWASYDLHLYPLKVIALILCNSVRIIDMMGVMDHRTTHKTSFTLMGVLIVEIISLLFAFWSIIEGGFLLDIATSQLPDFDLSADLGEGDDISTIHAATTELPSSDSGFSEDQRQAVNNLEGHLYNQDYHQFNPTGILDVRME